MSSESHHQAQADTTNGKRRAVVVVNELAPQARALNWVSACSQGLGQEVEVTEVRCASFDAVKRAAAEAAATNAWLVISVGGDGTLNYVINGVGTHPTLICPLPGGTANEVSKHLNMSTDLAKEASLLGQFEPIAIDTMRINGVRFLNIGLAGWSSDMVLGVNRLRSGSRFWRAVTKSLGPRIYTLYGLWLLLGRVDSIGGPIEITYRDLSDGSTKTIQETVINFGIYGPADQQDGKIFLSKGGSMTDGKFEATLTKQCTRRRALEIVASMGKGTNQQSPEVISIQTNWMQFKMPPSVEVSIDGEPYDSSGTYIVDFDPVPIRLLAPKGARPGTSKR